jgi:hypothetical protein
MGTFAETVIVDYRLQQSCRFPLVPFPFRMLKRQHTYIYAAVANEKWKREAQAIFLDPFTVCSSCKRESVVCSFVRKKRKLSVGKRITRTKLICPCM